MAITSFVKISATPNALKYYLESDAASTARQTVTQAELIAALPPGPLRQFLAGLTSVDWQRLLRSPVSKVNDKLDVSSMARSISTDYTGPAPAVEFTVSGDVLILSIVMPNAVDGAAGTVTLRYVHTQAR